MTPKTTLLTLGEAAERLGVSPGTLRNQANHGRIKATKRGRDWMVTEGEVQRYGAEQRRPGKAVLARGVGQTELVAVIPAGGPSLHELATMPAAEFEAAISSHAVDTFGAPRPAPKPGKR